MKSIKIVLLGLSISLFACNSTNKRNVTKDSIGTANTIDSPEKIVEERFLIIPGQSIGQISLGEDVRQVGKKLGKPDLSDAAMGKAWSIWYSKDKMTTRRNEVAIYSSYKDSTLTSKVVKQIRITSKMFKTQSGFGTEKTLDEIKSKFNDIEPVAVYLNERMDTVKIFDSKKEGIGFEFLKAKSISITVHPKNFSLSETYLAVHPEWKLVK